jgi:hypothetical protein
MQNGPRTAYFTVSYKNILYLEYFLGNSWLNDTTALTIIPMTTKSTFGKAAVTINLPPSTKSLACSHHQGALFRHS